MNYKFVFNNKSYRKTFVYYDYANIYSATALYLYENIQNELYKDCNNYFVYKNNSYDEEIFNIFSYHKTDKKINVYRSLLNVKRYLNNDLDINSIEHLNKITLDNIFINKSLILKNKKNNNLYKLYQYNIKLKNNENLYKQKDFAYKKTENNDLYKNLNMYLHKNIINELNKFSFYNIKKHIDKQLFCNDFLNVKNKINNDLYKNNILNIYKNNKLNLKTNTMSSLYKISDTMFVNSKKFTFRDINYNILSNKIFGISNEYVNINQNNNKFVLKNDTRYIDVIKEYEISKNNNNLLLNKKLTVSRVFDNSIKINNEVLISQKQRYAILKSLCELTKNTDINNLMILYNKTLDYDNRTLNIYEHTYINKNENEIIINKNTNSELKYKDLFAINNMFVEKCIKNFNIENKDIFLNKKYKYTQVNEILFISKDAKNTNLFNVISTNKNFKSIHIDKMTVTDKNSKDINCDILTNLNKRDKNFICNSILKCDKYYKYFYENKIIYLDKNKHNINLFDLRNLIKDFKIVDYNNLIDFSSFKEIDILNNNIFLSEIPKEIKLLFTDKSLSPPLRDLFIDNYHKWLYGDTFEKPDIKFGKIDELILPYNDIDYSKTVADKIVNKDGNILCDYKKIDNGIYEINTPVVNPLKNIYEQVGNEYIDLNVNMLTHLINVIYSVWQQRAFKYGGMDAPSAINDMLDLLLYYCNAVFFGTVHYKHALRVLRLFRWYSEFSINKYSKYQLIFNYSPLKSNIHKGDCEIPYELNNMYINNTMYTICNSILGKGCSCKFKVKVPIDTYFKCSIYLQNGYCDIYLNDTYIKSVNTKGKNDIKLDLLVNDNVNIIDIRYYPIDNSLINITNAIINDYYYKDYQVKYIPVIGNGNATLNDLINNVGIYSELLANNQEAIEEFKKHNYFISDVIERMKNYYEIHHSNKNKGKRLTIKKS